MIIYRSLIHTAYNYLYSLLFNFVNGAFFYLDKTYPLPVKWKVEDICHYRNNYDEKKNLTASQPHVIFVIQRILLVSYTHFYAT